ncbi:MAG: autorepressor SdpR family transcription factor [Rhizomicrobium sp.]|jgi:DNA-binding transcriptional ArsR family regulator
MTDVFAALASPARREILRLLRHGAMSAGDLAAEFDLAKPTLSGHFAVLKSAGLITSERKSTTILYRLNVTVLDEALAALMDIAGTGKAKTGGSRKWASAHR